MLDRLRQCGRKAIAGAVTLTGGDGLAGWQGIETCGSVHVCPVCAPAIRRARAAELEAAGDAWESVDVGTGTARGLVMVTLTMRHYARQSLAELVKLQREAWKRSFGQNALRTTKQVKKGLGVVGYVRAWETTHGPNGWHTHFHVAVFLEERPDARRVRVMERLIYRGWAAALERVGAYRPSEVHGVRVDAPGVGEAGQISRYLMKNPDKAWSAAQEMTRADAKGGRKGHRTPFEIGRSAVAGTARDVELWREYEEAATGLRALYWSQGLRDKLAELAEMDERTDIEVSAEDQGGEGKPVAHFPVRTWYGQIVRHKGRRLELLHATEKWGQSGVRTLTASWGLLWGVDVLPPEELPVEGPRTLAEVLAEESRALLQARADVWRREFDRQDRERRAARVVFQPGAWEARRDALEAAERRRAKERAAAPDRERIFREALRAAKARRPAAELTAAMSRFRSDE